MDFSKHMGETIMDISFNDVSKTWKEGLLMKKVCFTANTSEGEQTFKFGVFNTKGWLKSIDKAISDSKNQ
jgi:hypothetical protein